jgi:hypothetical protein
LGVQVGGILVEAQGRTLNEITVNGNGERRGR